MSWKKITHNSSNNPTVHYAIHSVEWMENLLEALKHTPIEPDSGDTRQLHLAHMMLDHFPDLKDTIDVDWGQDEHEIFDDLSEHYDSLINWHNSLVHTDDHAHNDPKQSATLLNSAESLQSHLWDVDLQKLTTPPDHEN